MQHHTPGGTFMPHQSHTPGGSAIQQPGPAFPNGPGPNAAPQRHPTPQGQGQGQQQPADPCSLENLDSRPVQPAVHALYAFPEVCSETGRRFHTKEQLQKHKDKLFQQKRSEGEAASRGWFSGSDVWLGLKLDVEPGPGPKPDDNDADADAAADDDDKDVRPAPLTALARTH